MKILCPLKAEDLDAIVHTPKQVVTSIFSAPPSTEICPFRYPIIARHFFGIETQKSEEDKNHEVI